MGKKLVIVESPAKAKTINKMLGDDYIVEASMGHIRDLPEKKLGVDIEKDFLPQYTTMKGKQKVVKTLEKAAKGVDCVYLAPDPDREGEAIAWHLKNLLKDKVSEDQFFRVTYNEITAPAIRAAFEQPGAIDMNRVDSQQARRILDRIVGYKVSPLLWKRVPGGASAGRVQSVALRLVCEREREIIDFVKEKYWVLSGIFRKQTEPLDEFEAKLTKVDGKKADVRAEEIAVAMLNELSSATYSVGDVRKRELVKRARPPYITSTLQQAASGMLGFSPTRTMSIAQRLYEGGEDGMGGLITYMRTDSFSIAKEAQASCRAFIETTYGDDYLPAKPNFYKSRKSAQEAHEAIRPTNVLCRPDDLKGRVKPEELKLYRLIWQRFVASQMAPARIAQRSVDIQAHAGAGLAPLNHEYIFRATASDIIFPGYMKVTGAETAKVAAEEDSPEAVVEKLPQLAVEEPLDCVRPEQVEKETQPPPRYSEASLVRALEENGVGRPSTYASIISTILNRKYILREKRTLKPTELGVNVNAFLMEHLPNLFEVGFTASMEEQLDEIENGTVQWTAMLKEFYGSFEEWLEKAKGPKADPHKIDRLLTLLETVQNWAPEQKRGKRTYSDCKFVASVRKQQTQGKRALSERQRDSLLKLVGKYGDQLKDAEVVLAELELSDRYNEVNVPEEPPREASMQKLNGFDGVKFDEPHVVGKRTYDDHVFLNSLKEQVENGKRLSERQVQYLDRLLVKYADQLGGKDAVLERFELNRSDEAMNDTESGPLLEMLGQVVDWNEPTKRGKRVWDDRVFYDSLKGQFDGKKVLSPRQRASLKKMVQRYHEQIKGYDTVAESLGLKKSDELKKRKPKKEAESTNAD